MKKPDFNSINTKITLWLTLGAFWAMSTFILFNFFKSRNIAIQSAEQHVSLSGHLLSEKIKTNLESALTTSRVLSQMMLAIKTQNDSTKLNRTQVNSIVKNLLNKHSDFLGIGIFWEPNAFDNHDILFANTEGHDATGHFIPYWYLNREGEANLDAYSACYTSEFYFETKRSKIDMVLNPYLFQLGDSNLLITTFVSPIVYNGVFQGVTAADIPIGSISEMVNNLKLFSEETSITVFSNNGTIVATSESKDLVSKQLSDISDNFEKQIFDIQEGVETIFYKDDFLHAYTPVYFSNIKTPWQVHIKIPKWEILKPVYMEFIAVFFLNLLIAIIVVFIVNYLINRFLRPIKLFRLRLKTLSEGKLRNYKKIKTTDTEMRAVDESLSRIFQNLKETIHFIAEIAKGKLEVDFQQVNKDDVLKNSLIHLQKKLIETRKKEKEYEAEDKKHKWIDTGLSLFSDLVKKHESDLSELSNKLISKLIEYLKANQGGLFLYKEGETEAYFELAASYAFDRKKFITRKIAINEGLLGTCAAEKKAIYMRDVPNEYAYISSGTGKAKPTAILITPLIHNEKVIGVIELASFQEFSEEEQSFVEQLSKTIAVTIDFAMSVDKMKQALEKAQTDLQLANEREILLLEKIDELEIENSILNDHENE